MQPRESAESAGSRGRLAAALGVAAGALLLASLFLPYWQARLFAPQYRNGLVATMYAYKVVGDVGEIDELNHYVGVRKLAGLGVWERRLAIPVVLCLSALCLIVFRKTGGRPSWLKVIPVALYPVVFVADLKFWLHSASTKLDPTAALKLKPFVIPLMGTGKVGQFRSEVGPMSGFYLAAAAAILLLMGFWLTRRRRGAAVLLLVCAVSAQAQPLQKLVDAAPAGAVLDLAPGTYEGPLLIGKRLTLRGGGRAVIDNGRRGTVVTVRAGGSTLEGLILRGSGDSLLHEDSGVRIEAPSVTLRGCRIEDVLFGAFISNAPGAVIEGNVFIGKPLELGRRGDLLRLWNSDRAVVRGNTLERGRDMVLWFSTGSVVEGNTVTGARYGLHFMYTNGAVVKGNVFRGNSVGAYIMYSRGLSIEGNRFEGHRGPSGTGLGLKESGLIRAAGNVFAGNRQALFIDQSPLVPQDGNEFTLNRFANNDIGVALMPGVRGNVIFENDFEDNLQQVSVRGGGQLSGNEWSRGGRGNYWSDYAGYGRAGAQVGLVPYRAENVVERLADARPQSRFFLYTPAALALETAARAFPVFRVKALMSDPHPLLRPRSSERSQSPAPAPALAALWLPAGFLSLSAAAAAVLSRRKFSQAPLRPRGGADSLEQGQPMIWAQGLSKAYGGFSVFEGLTFPVMPGECLVLWGSNGAGKSTLIRCLLGLESCEGALVVAGHDVALDSVAARRRIGYVCQEFAGYDWTVRQAMEFICAVRGLDCSKVPGALAVCGLTGQEEKAVPELSGGMKQKLALAQALVAEPDILLLDEPCSNLDLKSRRELLAILKRLKGARTMLITSHHLDEVEALADRVLWLEEGLEASDMSPERFLARMQSAAAEAAS
jgi:nitrous oxidase accessory protein